MPTNEPYTLPVQLRDKSKIVNWISEITAKDEEVVLQRLRQEYDDCGTSVRQAFRNAGLSPFEWTNMLGKFYEDTDAFLYELVMWNMNKHKRRLRRWTRNYLKKHSYDGARVLCIGDGLGFDTAYFAQLGYNVTYFERCDYSRQFAEKVFAETAGQIQVITEENLVGHDRYDAVVCLDVLEHVPDVDCFVAKLAGYLRKGGNLIVHAPFYMIHRSKPTHLKSNRRYSGSLSLYRKHSFALIDGKPLWMPLVFRKKTDGDKDGLKLYALWLRLTGLALLLGRFTVLPFLWANVYHKKKQEWFGKRGYSK